MAIGDMVTGFRARIEELNTADILQAAQETFVDLDVLQINRVEPSARERVTSRITYDYSRAEQSFRTFKKNFVLRCNDEIRDMLLVILEAAVIRQAQGRMSWDIGRCPTFADFIARSIKQQSSGEISLYIRLTSLQSYKALISTLIPEFNVLKEKHEHRNTRIKPSGNTQPAASQL